MMSDNPQHRPRETGNPNLDKFLSTVGSEENAQAHAEATRTVYEQFNSGAPIAVVNPSDLKQLWEVTRRMNADMPPRPGVAIGLAVFAAYGFEAASASPEQRVPIQLRCQLMSALVERGVLNDYLHGEELDERAFRAAATMPCDKIDLGEAMIPQMLATYSAEIVEKAKEEMRAGGYDPDKPNVDNKFLDWLRSSSS
jgi:hypothetical protein